MNKYKIIALCGESGAGKDFTLREVVEWDNSTFNPTLHRITHTTTRPKRDNEENGKDYYFLTLSQYSTKTAESLPMVEVAYKGNWYYSIFEQDLSTEKINIGAFSPAMLEQMSKDPRVELVVVKIAATDKTRLIRQLQRMTNPDIEEIFRRYQTDKEDFKNLNIDYTLINEDEQDKINNLFYILNLAKNFGQSN